VTSYSLHSIFILAVITSNYEFIPLACHTIHSNRPGTCFSIGAFLLVEEATGNTLISALETIIDICAEALIAELKFRILRFIEKQQ